MIRTRNFVLYILCVFFLAMAMTVSLTYYGPGHQTAKPSVSLATSSVGVSIGATAPTDTIDRAANLDHLLAAIKASPEVVTPHPSVPDTIVVGSSSSEPAAPSPGTVILIDCPFPDDALPFVPKWPIYDVAMATREGARIVYTSAAAADSMTGTSSATTTSTLVKTLLQLPIDPQKTTAANCVPSEVVGVTTRGTLIFNGDVAAYRDTNADTLIGYARDGFPIYGMYNGPTDKCGGYNSPTGYHYTVSSNRKFILGCFAGIPQKFTF